MVGRHMSALRCLCCEHVNRVGAKFCEQCGSTLNLKLCEHCEAINESSAQRCYKCDAKFPAEPAVDQLKSVQTALGELSQELPVQDLNRDLDLMIDQYKAIMARQPTELIPNAGGDGAPQEVIGPKPR